MNNQFDFMRGVGVAIVTPFNDDETVDYNSLEKIINHLINGGVQYIVSLGTTGETPTLTKEEKKQIAHYTLNKVAERLPVVIGIGGYNTNEVIEQITYLEAHKFAATLSVAPFYNKPSQEGIYQHFKKIAESTTCSIILYNVPGRTGRNMEVSTTVRLANDFSNIVAIKEASSNIVQSMQLIASAPEGFIVLSGDDDLLLPQIACGFQGVISVVANSYPTDFSNMVQLALSNDYKAARTIHYKLLPAIEMMFAENNPAGIKSFLNHQGFCAQNFRLPAMPVSEALDAKIKAFVTHN